MNSRYFDEDGNELLKTPLHLTRSPLTDKTDKSPFVIGVAGGSSSGKTTVCQKIMEELGQNNVSDNLRKVVCISQDAFYRNLSESDAKKAVKGCYDFDHPSLSFSVDAIDVELLQSTLQKVSRGEKAEIPVYDFVRNRRMDGQSRTVYPADVILVEGILAFYFPEIREFFKMKLFVDTDPDTRLARRVLRDVNERERDLETVLTQYTGYVKPAFEEFCLPTKKFADVIIPRGADNKVAISLIVQHIKDILDSDPEKLHADFRKRPTAKKVAKRPH